MKYKFISLLSIVLLAVGVMAGQIYAKAGADDPPGDDRGSSDSSSGSQSREAEQRGQEAEARGRAAEGEAPRGADNEGGNEIEFEIENENGAVEFDGSNFEIRGKIESISGSTFVIAGKIITVDPSMVVNFQQTIPLAVGEDVKIEGMVDENDVMFAREIKPLIESALAESAIDNSKQDSNRQEDKQSNGDDSSQKQENRNKGILADLFERIFRLFFR